MAGVVAVKPRCNRTWEVAAARDGRLGAKARDDHELHLERCEDCAAEHDALEALGERLRSAPVTEPDALALRRLRARTLEAADAAVVARVASRRSPRLLVACAAVALAGSVGIAWHRLRPPSAETRFVATDEGGAHWSAHDEGEVRHIDLRSGALAVWVDRPAGGKRVIVHVPDGDIEDTGTVFHIGVADGHTQRVRVDEGSVVVRLDGQLARSLRAGETWERAREAPAAPAPAAPAPPTSGEAVPAPVPAAPSAVPSPRPIATLATSIPSPAADPSHADASDEEDRAYVEIVRLLREGRDTEARSAARDYVRRFPQGFRRAEVDRVLGVR